MSPLTSGDRERLDAIFARHGSRLASGGDGGTGGGAPDRPPVRRNEGFRGPQVCALVGITYRMLDYWARTDLIRPSIADARGSGTQRRYSYGDIVELKVVKKLLDTGIELQTARRVIDYLRDNLGGEIATANLVISGGSALLARSDAEIVDIVRQGHGVINIVPLGNISADLDTAIAALGGQDA